LLERGASLEEVDKEGTTPLMIACACGRLDNVRFIVETLGAGGSGAARAKMGVGGTERPQKNSWRPIHLAAADGRLEVVRYLLDLGVSADAPLNVRGDRMTPTMIAAASGDLVRRSRV
jgi:ankyrin repeat protein